MKAVDVGYLQWRCTVCGYIYDERKEGIRFEDLPDDWACPVCGAPKSALEEAFSSKKPAIVDVIIDPSKLSPAVI
ncbi:MAG: rubredoxin [archaeon]|nr:rubredoxin [archaeon]MCP8315172.1 rubredoxin [archaeon]